MKIKAVIGAAYGDEGKGLMTDYLAAQAFSEGSSPTVVRFNGGAQAGHTVTTPEGQRHVFHHFGSATFQGADTYLTEDFLVNPIVFENESLDLHKAFAPKTAMYVHPAARFTTPFDMVLNQVLEKQRQAASTQHGSCGMGIFETMLRYRDHPELCLSIGQFSALDETDKRKHLTDLVENYFVPRAYKILEGEFMHRALTTLQRQDLVEEFLRAWWMFYTNATFTTTFMQNASDDATLIFEGAQGLMLDQRHPNFPHVTPSSTGTANIAKLLKCIRETNKLDVEVVYVTRAYVTRHGAGPLAHELKGPPFGVIDLTNIPNSYQETLRFGTFDLDIFQHEVAGDLINSSIGGWTTDTGHKFKVSCAMTCLDQAQASPTVTWRRKNMQHTDSGVGYASLMSLLFDYVSFGPTRSTVARNAYPYNLISGRFNP